MLGHQNKRSLAYIIALMFVFAPLTTSAKHGAPPRVDPLVEQGIRFVLPNDQGRRAYVEAWDVQTGQKL